jgi:hypothetical protein
MSIKWVMECSWATVVFDCCFRFDRETVGLVLGKKERERERERERDMVEVVCACHVRAEELFWFFYGKR